ncbi:MAG: hypothetical protein A3H79_00370 [Candidatus Levybacteria bacterium RIFCSPLOWO2_02_FULL_36_8b]|nr:MAG: hypothetical protein A3H79_00370 [Candidatus Levybacteria bacterium RIFCSPLOWO2_02_FULL_36_8b]
MDNQNEQLNTNDVSLSFFSKVKIFLSANKLAVIFIAVLGTISFSTTGYLLTANNKTPPQNRFPQENIPPISPQISPPQQVILNASPTASPSSSSISKPTASAIDPTASWSAYVSTKYSYSVKYPPGWNAQITTQQDPKILEYVVFNPTATKAGTLSITLSYGNRTYTQAQALDPQTGESILVASVSATKKSSKDSNGYKATNVIVPFGSNTIIFNAKDAFSTLFNQMLTTLKLTK